MLHELFFSQVFVTEMLCQHKFIRNLYKLPSKRIPFIKRGERHEWSPCNHIHLGKATFFKGWKTPLALLQNKNKNVYFNCPRTFFQMSSISPTRTMKRRRGKNNHNGYEHILLIFPTVPFVFRRKLISQCKLFSLQRM